MKAGNNGYVQLCELLLNRGADVGTEDEVCETLPDDATFIIFI
jgi:hypothetical protein